MKLLQIVVTSRPRAMPKAQSKNNKSNEKRQQSKGEIEKPKAKFKSQKSQTNKQQRKAQSGSKQLTITKTKTRLVRPPRGTRRGVVLWRRPAGGSGRPPGITGQPPATLGRARGGRTPPQTAAIVVFERLAERTQKLLQFVVTSCLLDRGSGIIATISSPKAEDSRVSIFGNHKTHHSSTGGSFVE